MGSTFSSYAICGEVGLQFLPCSRRERTLPRYKPNKKIKKITRQANKSHVIINNKQFVSSRHKVGTLYRTTKIERDKKKKRVKKEHKEESSSGYYDTDDCDSSIGSLDSSCPICSSEVGPERLEGIYCTLGSVCSRRSSATIKSRKAKGKKKKRSKLNIQHSKTSSNVDVTHKQQTNLSLNKFIIPHSKEIYHPKFNLTDDGADCSGFVAEFDVILGGSLKCFLDLSKKIGGDVGVHCDMVDGAFKAQRAYLVLAAKSKKPSDSDIAMLLKPTSDKISDIQSFREKNRRSEFFNHLSAVSESIPALGWITVAPAPAPFVKEMNDAGQFYTNRVLKDWKEKSKTHVEWTKAWLSTLTELQAFVKKHHTTGLVWNPKGSDAKASAPPPPPPCAPAPPPPPPPGLFDDIEVKKPEKTARGALLDQLNQGDNITKGLKKVTADMQTHKNPELRNASPAKVSANKPSGSVKPTVSSTVNKPPKFELDGKKWMVEYQKNNNNLVIDGAEVNQSVYLYKCEGTTVKVNGKCNNVILDNCKKSAIVFDSVVSSCEFVNCQSVQMQVMGKCPTISVEKTDGCQMYLSKEAIDAVIVSAKSSEMNVLIPNGDDFVEQPIPEQFKTVLNGTKLVTNATESV